MRANLVVGDVNLNISAVSRLVSELFPGGSVEWMAPIGDDPAETGRGSQKACGYGEPARVWVRDAAGNAHDLVLHTATADGFGHEHRADRAAEMLLAFDTFGLVPRQAEAVDVGAIGKDGSLLSLREHQEFYLVTRYAPGRLYADWLRQSADRGSLNSEDLAVVDTLSSYLAALHAERLRDELGWRRAVRDLVGSGEGIFGLIDAYPEGADPAVTASLERIECLAVEWRSRLRPRSERMARIHGDFHPFNLLIDDHHHLATLDASRGAAGDPADDVVCLALNYVFFALERKELWRPVFAPMWWRFWERYLKLTDDRPLLTVAPPYLAWRALVLACPAWYPKLAPANRQALLDLAVHVLEQDALNLESVEEVFR